MKTVFQKKHLARVVVLEKVMMRIMVRGHFLKGYIMANMHIKIFSITS